jgi:hypothetical protein
MSSNVGEWSRQRIVRHEVVFDVVDVLLAMCTISRIHQAVVVMRDARNAMIVVVVVADVSFVVCIKGSLL